MGTSYRSIYNKLTSDLQKRQNPQDNALPPIQNPQENASPQTGIDPRLLYLAVAFDAYCDAQKKDKKNEPVNLQAYIKFSSDNPGFRHYCQAALLIYEEQLDAVAVEARRDEALKEAFKLALTCLISRGTVKVDDINTTIDSLVHKAQKSKKKDYSDVNDWHACITNLIVHKKPVDTQKKKEEINRIIGKAVGALEPFASYSTEPIIYDITKVVEYACKQYEDLRHPISAIRKKDLKEIRNILEKYKDEPHQGKKADLIASKIATHFSTSNFSRGFSSKLEDLVMQAIEDFSEKHKKDGWRNKNGYKDYKGKNDERTVQVKTWSDPKKESTKLVLAVHGVQDSVNTFDVVANQYVRKGYKVKSYDQSGAGFDESRGKEDLNIKQMQFDFYHMLEEAYRDRNVTEIVLLGHSLGGAVIANALNMIEDLNKNPPPGCPPDKIKKIQLISPAAMKDPLWQSFWNLGTIRSTNPGDKDEHTKLLEEKGIKRGGGAAASSSLWDFISIVARAFKRLVRATNDCSIPIEVHYSAIDGLVNKSNFEAMENSGSTKFTTFKNEAGQHHLHASSGSTIGERIEEISDGDTQTPPASQSAR